MQRHNNDWRKSMSPVTDAPASEPSINSSAAEGADGAKRTRRRKGAQAAESADVSYALAAEEPKDGLPKFTQVINNRGKAAFLALSKGVPLYMIQKMKVIEKIVEGGALQIDAEPATAE
jgi:hypothetical protein